MYSRTQYSPSKMILPVSPQNSKACVKSRFTVNRNTRVTHSGHEAQGKAESREQGCGEAWGPPSAHRGSRRLLSWKAAPARHSLGLPGPRTPAAPPAPHAPHGHAPVDEDRKQQRARAPHAGEGTRFKNSDSCTPSPWFPVKQTNQ